MINNKTLNKLYISGSYISEILLTITRLSKHLNFWYLRAWRKAIDGILV